MVATVALLLAFDLGRAAGLGRERGFAVAGAVALAAGAAVVAATFDLGRAAGLGRRERGFAVAGAVALAAGAAVVAATFGVRARAFDFGFLTILFGALAE